MSDFWKNLHIDGVEQIDRLVEEFWICESWFSCKHILCRVYEKNNGQLYAVAGVKIKKPKQPIFIRPRSEGTNTEIVLQNILIQVLDLVMELKLNGELHAKNIIESNSHEF